MQYGCSMTFKEVESLVVVLPLTTVPHFDPTNPPANSYGVPDDAAIGWIVTHNADGTVSFAAPPTSEPTATDQYQTAMTQGIKVTSSSTPALNGTYGVSSNDQSNVSSEALYISTFQEFTTGTDTINWQDLSGAIHIFPNTALFMTFAKATSQYVSACKQTIMTLTNGGTATFPSNTYALD